MTRFLLAVTAAALILTTLALTSPTSASAQSGAPPVCVSVPPGEYNFTAPARDREGDVSFSVTVGEGGVVTEFTEPGGQSIPPSAMLQLFTGEDAYALPDGVAIIECAADEADAMEEAGEAAATPVCVSLPPGSHSASVSAGGQSYEITINIGAGSEVISVEVLGQTYSAQDALDLLAGFGAVLPPQIQIIECAADDADAMSEDSGSSGSSSSPQVYPTTGTGGLAVDQGATGFWAAIATVAGLFLVAAAIAARRRVAVRNRD